jgi:hypothetical protein
VLWAGMWLEEHDPTLLTAALQPCSWSPHTGSLRELEIYVEKLDPDVADGFKECKLETLYVYGWRQDSSFVEALRFHHPSLRESNGLRPKRQDLWRGMVGTSSGDLYEGRALGAGPLDRPDVLAGSSWHILCGDLSSTS